jgi:hypothetical protein
MRFKDKFCGLRKCEELHCAEQRVGVRTDDHPSKKVNSIEISIEERRDRGRKKAGWIKNGGNASEISS